MSAGHLKQAGVKGRGGEHYLRTFLIIALLVLQPNNAKSVWGQYYKQFMVVTYTCNKIN